MTYVKVGAMRVTSFVVGGFACFLSASASAQVPLYDSFGGPEGFGRECLFPNDDQSSDEIDLTSAFPRGLRFFSETHTSVYVNTNGNITFSGALWTFTPNPFPVADQPMIAPYWADVDTRAGVEFDWWGGSGTCEQRASNEVWWYLEPGKMVVTWDEVGYYSMHDDKEMSFQLILTAVEGCGGEGDFDVEFRYNQCEWTTGDASDGSGGFGGTPAQAGFDAGDNTNYVMIPGSRTADIHTILCTDSNVGEPGIWRFQVRSGAIVCPGAGEECPTGGLGVCGVGRTQCVGDGTECVEVNEASDERCDALDNDCDGDTDEGELCDGQYEVCSRGVCVDACFEGGCAEGFHCNDEGLCVDTACESMTCEEGQRCERGRCLDACEGIVCPAGLSCSEGRCTDLCAELTCDDCTVCSEGSCVSKCQYTDCPSGQVCTDSGACVDEGCEEMVCPEGTTCQDGTCEDSCRGAVCPAGEMCAVGRCVPMTSVDPTVDGGTPTTRDAGPGTGPGEEPDGRKDNVRGGSRGAECLCRTAPGAGSSGALSLIVVSLLGLVIRFRARRS